ncbi:MAG: hypothetical protein QOJ37_2609 [Pseudonocardiales bacterium]|jgi:hypothetical protein|nr:hypothetical protein [Jatrophihabitans sp.]MDT4905090.1 hypothetical protein [Pseudonocardiales bacterium]MDT4950014.1 hypothetical protein [Pseudonocardiales bacterium]
MLLFDGALGVIAIGVWIFCIIDVITTPEKQVRNLPKLFWLLIVILLVDIGSIAWLFAGRPWSEKARARNVGGTGDRGWGPAARSPMRPSNPDDDEDFLAGLRARAEEQRRRARDTKQGEEPQGGAGPTA